MPSGAIDPNYFNPVHNPLPVQPSGLGWKFAYGVIPLLGNYCGPGYSQGQFLDAYDKVIGGSPFPLVKTVNDIDTLCIPHDEGYALNTWWSTLQADAGFFMGYFSRIFVSDNSAPLSDNIYGLGAAIYFGVKTIVYDAPSLIFGLGPSEGPSEPILPYPKYDLVFGFGLIPDWANPDLLSSEYIGIDGNTLDEDNPEYFDFDAEAYDSGSSFGYTSNAGWGQDSPSEHGPGPGGVTTPVVIDLSQGTTAEQKADGLNFLDLYHSPVFYNSDKDRFLERTAWVGPNDGIVVFVQSNGKVLDPNHDNEINASEIALTRIVKGADTDMEALYIGFDKGYDSDGNGTIDKGVGDHKISWQEADQLGLRIWRDADSDGVLDDGEMVTFHAAGIDSIDMNGTNIDKLKRAKDASNFSSNDLVEARYIDGSVVFGGAKVSLVNGDETIAYDMGFAHERTGMIEQKDADGFVTQVLLERAAGTDQADWQYKKANAGSTGVTWKFAADAIYFGATGSDGADTISYEGTSRRSFAGGAGNDVIQTGAGDDFLIGGDGADKLYAGNGDDVLYIDADDTVIQGGEGFDVVKVNSAAGVTLKIDKAGVEAFFGGAGNDTVSADTDLKGVIMAGNDGNDTLSGGEGNDVLLGGDGNDNLSGGVGDDQLTGGDGKDAMSGGDGDDTIFADEYDDFTKITGGAGFDMLIIDDSLDDSKTFSMGFKLDDLGFEAAVGGGGNDILTVTTQDDTLLFGMKGNDTLTTGIGDDLIGGGAGNDTLNGNGGSDTYLFGRGDGDDVIEEVIGANVGAGGLDVIGFGGDIDAEDLQFNLNAAGNLIISLRVADGETLSGESIVIKNWSDSKTQIELLSFADSTVLDIAGAHFTTLGADNDSNADLTSANNKLVGASNQLDVIDADGGNDIIDARDGNDIVFGRAGNDTLSGGKGHDYLSGGSGADELSGEEDDDTLIGGSGNDALKGGGGDDYLDGGTGRDTLGGGKGNDQLYGGDNNDTLNGGDGDDMLVGGNGNDTLNGGGGDDVYLIGRDQGIDVITDRLSDDDRSKDIIKRYGEDRQGDRIAFGSDIDLTDLVFDMHGDDLVIGISRNGSIYKDPAKMANRVEVANWDNGNNRIERLNFYNGSVLYVEKIDDAYSGSNKSNSFDDSNKNSLISGGNGNDKIEGHRGNDVILGGNGNDRLDGVGGDDILFGGAGNDVLIGDQGIDRLFGGDGDDTIYADSWKKNSNDYPMIGDYIVGGAGNDTLYGSYYGIDTYVFGYGAGTDTIVGGKYYDETYDTLMFEDGIWFSDMKVTWDDERDMLKIQLLSLNQPSDSPTTIYVDALSIGDLKFANGYRTDFSLMWGGKWGDEGADKFDCSDLEVAVWLAGNDGKDVLKGGDGRDYLIGGHHDDILKGGNGSDYYIYNYGDGRDTITESGKGKNAVYGGTDDVIIFGPGITLYDLAMRTDDTDLVIALRNDNMQNFEPVAAEDQIRIENWNIPDCRVEWVGFDDGSLFEIGMLENAIFLAGDDDEATGGKRAEWFDGGSGNDKINAADGDDIVFGRDGDDTLNGGNGGDTLYGENGDDKITGGNGKDFIHGGLGNDQLSGQAGSDKLYGSDGDDILSDGAGSNLLSGGLGNDTIHRGGFIKGGGLDKDDVVRLDHKIGVTVVEFSRGDGQDTLYVDGSDSKSGMYDQIDLFNIDSEDVWFQKNGVDLILKILGTEDQMTFSDFYHKGTDYKFDQINANGKKLEYSDIDALVVAMAGYVPSNGDSGEGISTSELPDAIIKLINDKWDPNPDYHMAA